MSHVARVVFSLALLVSTWSFAAASQRGVRANQAWRLSNSVTTSVEDARKKLSTELQTALDKAGPGDRLRVIVRLKSAALPVTANERKREATASVVSHLQADAQARQRAALDFLAQPAIAAQTGEVRSLWIINALALTAATPAVVNALAARDDVESVAEDGWRQWITPPSRGSAIKDSRSLTVTQDALTGVNTVAPAAGDSTWGIKRIRADQVWRGLGVTGAGVVVANMDTGVDWNHPSLRANYRGLGNGIAVDHAHNWLDATNEGSLYPTDGTGHGTHTMGTLAGADGIGVAPGAKWMAAKALNSDGFGYDTWIHEAFQFILAPGGRPDLAPDILSGSWGNNNGSTTVFQEDLRALQRAGILTIFASGNAGPALGSVGSPASLPETFAVGATADDDTVARFSSRGPSPIDQRLKPEITAPGVGVVSAFPGAAYSRNNGTSMAAPHVAGSAALVLSARPSLSAAEITNVLTRTAVPLSTTLPNNHSGWGRVDAYAAVLQVIDTAVIDGYVRDGATPVSGAEVVATNTAGLSSRAQTDPSGYFSMTPVPGAYTVSANAFGYSSASSPMRVVGANTVAHVNLSLGALPSGIVRGTVRDAANGTYITATMRALGTPRAGLSNLSCLPCRYSIDLPTGTYVIEARANGYQVQTQTVTLSNGALADLNFDMIATQRIALVDSGAWYHLSAAQYYRDAFELMRLAVDEYAIKDPQTGSPTITDLLKYDVVVWSAPYDSPALVSAGKVISQYLSTGRLLLLSGQDMVFYDGGGKTYEPYLTTRVNARLIADDSDTRLVYGASGGPLAGISLTLTGGASADNQLAPDIIDVVDGDLGSSIANYSILTTTATGAATMTGFCSKYRAAQFGFGLESVSSVDDRAAIIARTLAGLSAPLPLLGLDVSALERTGADAAIGPAGTSVTHAFRVWNTGAGGVTQTFSIAAGSPAWPTQLSSKSLTLPPCASSIVTATVSIPATVQKGERDGFVVSVKSTSVPTLSDEIAFESRTPQSILVIDDDRWFDKEAEYLGALSAAGYAADRWNTANTSGVSISPTLAFMRMYPMVIWFNAYDWFDPIRPDEESLLVQYLTGGGRVFMTSQAALAYTGRSLLVRQYFGVDGIDFTDTTSNVIGMNDTTLGDAIPGGSLLPFPYSWNLSSSVLPTQASEVLLRGNSLQPVTLIRDGGIWRTAFMPMALEAFPKDVQWRLMSQITGWLSPAGTSRFTASSNTPAPGEMISLTLDAHIDNIPLPEGESLTIEWHAPNGLSLQTPPLSETVQVAPGQVIRREGRLRVDDQVAPGTTLPVTVRLRLNKSGFVIERQQRMRIGAPKAIVAQHHAPVHPRWGARVTVTVQISEAANRAMNGWVISSTVPSGMRVDTGSISATGAEWEIYGNVLVLTANGGTQPVTAVFVVVLPAFSGESPAAYQIATLVSDGSGDTRSSQHWVVPFTQNTILTFVSKPVK